MKKEMILVTGANGQIGTVLTESLRQRYGQESVLATDIQSFESSNGPFQTLNVLDGKQLKELVKNYAVTTVYHLAAILSAKGELNPKKAWDLNMNGLFNVLELARSHQLKVFFPSSIAAFGGLTPAQNTPQHTIMQPSTVYGISKVAGEHWCAYYHQKFGVDVRSLRYPGIISHQTLPGGGTTDYAVDIYHQAVKEEAYQCFLKANTRLPMLYMPDTIRATIELMEAPHSNITVRTSYNLAGMSFTPEDVANEIRKHLPNFTINYSPDFRQDIAESWPESIDDHLARKDWGWQAEYDLEKMTKDMLFHLQKKYTVASSLQK